MGGILNDFNSLRISDRVNSVKIRRMARQMDNNYSPRFVRYFAGYILSRYIHRVRLHIGEYRRRTDIAHRMDGRDKGHRRDDNLIARPDVVGCERQMKRSRAGIESDHEAGARIFGEQFFKLLGFRSKSEPA